MASVDQARASIGALHLAISNSVVAHLRDYTGRGPTKARTSIRDNVVVVILEQTLTKGERSLVALGREVKVLEIRQEFQAAMRESCSAAVAALTGRTVLAMLSANHINPDIAAEIFVLDSAPTLSESATATSNGDDGEIVG